MPDYFPQCRIIRFIPDIACDNAFISKSEGIIHSPYIAGRIVLNMIKTGICERIIFNRVITHVP